MMTRKHIKSCKEVKSIFKALAFKTQTKTQRSSSNMKTKFVKQVRFQRSEFFFIQCQECCYCRISWTIFQNLISNFNRSDSEKLALIFISFITAAVSDIPQSVCCGHWSLPIGNKNDLINVHIDSVPQLRFLTTKTRQQLQDTQRRNWWLKSVTVTRLFPEYDIMQLIDIYRCSIFIASIIRGMSSGSMRGHRFTRGVIPPRDWRRLLGCISWRECSVFGMVFLPSLPILKQGRP
jgi:hypothetical protein